MITYIILSATEREIQKILKYSVQQRLTEDHAALKKCWKIKLFFH